MMVSTFGLRRLGNKRTGTYCVTCPLDHFLENFSDKIQTSSGMKTLRVTEPLNYAGKLCITLTNSETGNSHSKFRGEIIL